MLSTVALFTGVAGFAALPALAAPAAAIVPSIVSPMDGTTIHDVPDVNGTGEPGTTVVIKDGGGTTVCSATVDELGNFACTGAGRLPAGLNVLTVAASAPDATVGNTVQIQALYYPSLSHPAPGSLVSTMQAFSGTALPGTVVRMLDAVQTTVCTTTADEFGNFLCVPRTPFALGTLTLAPSMTTTEGAVVPGDSATWKVIADPVITSPRDGDVVGDLPVFTGTGYPGAAVDIVHGRSGASLCTATVKADGTFSCPITRHIFVGSLEVFPALFWGQESDVRGSIITVAVEVTPKIVRPADGVIVAAQPIIEGAAGAFSKIAILDETGKTVCAVVASENGAFVCAGKTPLSPGKHSLTPSQTSLAGVVNRGATVNVTVPGTV
ncbi:MAG: Ig-like domain-containing protein, partial [Specibacter sp.]